MYACQVYSLYDLEQTKILTRESYSTQGHSSTQGHYRTQGHSSTQGHLLT
jgi:hypothetical protein